MITGPIGTLKPGIKKIHIYGAGISGLLMGYYLKQKGYEITLFEKNARVGGLIQTLNKDGHLIETAANTLYTNDDAIELLTELNLPYIPMNTGLKKKIMREHKALSFPFSFLEFISVLIKLFKAVPKTNTASSVADFFKPFLGNKLNEEVLTPMLSGIYSMGAHELHFGSLFEKVQSTNYFNLFLQIRARKKAQSKKYKISKPVGFSGGMEVLVNALEKELKGHIVLNANQVLDESVNNIICTHAHAASEILISKPDLSLRLKNLKYLSISTTVVVTNRAILELKKSFGILFSRKTNFKTLGIINNKEIFPGRTKVDNYSYTFIKYLSNSDALEVEADFKQIAGFELNSSLVLKNETHWPHGIPAYDQNRFEQIEAIHQSLLKHPGIVIFGNYVGGISIREMISGAKRFAQAL